jgi:hypothetical protein
VFVLALTCGMRSRTSALLDGRSLVLTFVSLAVFGCKGPAGGEGSATPEDFARSRAALEGEAQLPGPEDFGVPPRWQIDGTTVAEDPALPPALDRALREHGRRAEEVQDHVVVDLNGDGRLDAALLLPAPAIAGAYDHLVLLSEGESVRVHVLGDLTEGALFSLAVLPLVDGPTLIAVAPRLGSCERGPEWSFLRPTGDLLEPVGRIAVEPFDCAEAEAEIRFVRGEDGRVSAIEVRHGEVLTRYAWDASLGSFTPEAGA